MNIQKNTQSTSFARTKNKTSNKVPKEEEREEITEKSFVLFVARHTAASKQ